MKRPRGSVGMDWDDSTVGKRLRSGEDAEEEAGRQR